jgi:hypothetical protein
MIDPLPDPLPDPLDLELGPVVAGQPDPLLFATVCGARLYGFPQE